MIKLMDDYFAYDSDKILMMTVLENIKASCRNDA
jgi:hypothetical protein